MKMRKLLFLPLVLVALVLGACDSSDPDEDDFTGRYELRSVEGESLPAVLVEVGNDKVEVTAGHVNLNADNTFSTSLTLRTTEGGNVTTETNTSNGTFIRNGDVFRFTYPDDSEDTGSLVGETLTVTSQGVTLVFAK